MCITELEEQKYKYKYKKVAGVPLWLQFHMAASHLPLVQLSSLMTDPTLADG